MNSGASAAENATALLVMDVQAGVVQRVPGSAQVLPQVARAIEVARDRSIPVGYVTVQFRPGHPEVSSRNKGFAAVARGDGLREDDPLTGVHPSVRPEPDDLVVVKRRISAFAGSDLSILLRSLGVTRLVLSGIATSGVVLSTVREAADRDFELVVLADACADADADVHRILMERVFPQQATVQRVNEWAASAI
jgi:nicotinamidase-related amidase